MTTEQYVEAVLSHMPASMPRREQIGTELRSHIIERLEHGVPLDEVLHGVEVFEAIVTSAKTGKPVAVG